MKATALTLLAVISMFCSCEKKGYGSKIRGKLVYESCAAAVVQVLDSAYYHLGENSWQHSPSEPVFNNVFTIANKCSFTNKDMAVGEVFYFRLTNSGDQGCVICMMADYTPSVSQKICVVAE